MRLALAVLVVLGGSSYRWAADRNPSAMVVASRLAASWYPVSSSAAPGASLPLLRRCRATILPNSDASLTIARAASSNRSRSIASSVVDEVYARRDRDGVAAHVLGAMAGGEKLSRKDPANGAEKGRGK